MFLFFEMGCKMDVACSKGNSLLHYAVINNNIQLIQKIVHLDSDYGVLRKRENLKGETPFDLIESSDKDLLVTIWDVVR